MLEIIGKQSSTTIKIKYPRLLACLWQNMDVDGAAEKSLTNQTMPDIVSRGGVLIVIPQRHSAS